MKKFMKVYFYIYTLLSVVGVLGIVGIFAFNTLSVFDTVWISLSAVVTVISVIALYSYSFGKQLFTEKIWLMIFVLLILSTVDELFAYFSGNPGGLFGYITGFNISEEIAQYFSANARLIGAVISLPSLYALYMLSKGKMLSSPENNNGSVEDSQKKNNIWKTVGILVVILVFILGISLFNTFKQAPFAEEQVVKFMEAVSSQDFETAYEDLTSERFKTTATYEEFVEGMNFLKAQYSEFEEVKLTYFGVKKYAGQPTTYIYTGIITYSNGEQGELGAILEKEDDEYKISGIQINVSAERAKSFQEVN